MHRHRVWVRFESPLVPTLLTTAPRCTSIAAMVARALILGSPNVIRGSPDRLARLCMIDGGQNSGGTRVDIPITAGIGDLVDLIGGGLGSAPNMPLTVLAVDGTDAGLVNPVGGAEREIFDSSFFGASLVTGSAPSRAEADQVRSMAAYGFAPGSHDKQPDRVPDRLVIRARGYPNTRLDAETAAKNASSVRRGDNAHHVKLLSSAHDRNLCLDELVLAALACAAKYDSSAAAVILSVSHSSIILGADIAKVDGLGSSLFSTYGEAINPDGWLYIILREL